jgi:hypothetical protein
MKNIKYTGFRRTIGEYTKLASKIPTIHETTEINITGLQKYCKENSVTITSVIIKVLASVQKKYPIVNSFIARDKFLRKRIYFPNEVDMAVAIEMNEYDCYFSTIAVFHNINNKTIHELMKEIKHISQLSYTQMPLAWLTTILDKLPDFFKSIGINIVLQIPKLRTNIFGTMGFSSLGKYGLKSFDTLFITPPTNKLNYAIITYGKNRWKKTNTKRVVWVKKDSNKAKKERYAK